MQKIKVAVAGFGNLGRACVKLIKSRPEFELAAVFSRRAVPGTVPFEDVDLFRDKIDVVLVCVGSSNDAPNIVPHLAKTFNTVDSFDTHAKLSEYKAAVHNCAIQGKTTAIVATGWDPGLFSVMRIYFDAFFNKQSQTFWGPGISLGHTNAIKNIDGVESAIQFTVPNQNAITKARKGHVIPPKQKHKRICYVVAPPNLQLEIEHKIKTMPDYFAGFETEVNFISACEFKEKFSGRTNHAGRVIATNNSSIIDLKLRLKYNSNFTASVMLAYAIANHQLQKEGKIGAFSVGDIAPKHLMPNDYFEKI